MYKIIVYVPCESVDSVKRALFESGAGKIGNYEQCCWQREGIGQFKPTEGSDPFVGVVSKVEQIKETKLELVCTEQYIKAAITSMLVAHPYEQPAYQIVPFLTLEDL